MARSSADDAALRMHVARQVEQAERRGRGRRQKLKNRRHPGGSLRGETIEQSVHSKDADGGRGRSSTPWPEVRARKEDSYQLVMVDHNQGQEKVKGTNPFWRILIFFWRLLAAAGLTVTVCKDWPVAKIGALQACA